MRRRLAPVLVLAALLLVAAPAAAEADAFLPPPGKVFHGVTGGPDVGSFSAETGKHAPVFQVFAYWNQRLGTVFDGAARSSARPMIHLSTWDGRRELITPGAIARGEGDDYLLFLNRRIADYGGVFYVRLMSEMNAHWNVYSAFDRSGRSRGRDHSTAAFRRAWRRTALILRGGPVAEIDRRLAALRLPAVRGAGGELPRPRVSFLWVPQVAGAPNTRANSPRAYWPGGAYVDWVGTDFYSKFPNFSGLERFYRAFPRKPFAFGEWALWVRDDPAFVTRLFSWVRRRPRVRMMMYNQGLQPGGPFRLSRYPRGHAALRRALASPRFAPYAPELAPR